MTKDIKIKDYNVHFEQGKNGAIIVYRLAPSETSDGEQHIFQPFFTKHQDLYEVYKLCRDKQLLPEDLLKELSSFRYRKLTKHQLTIDFRDRVQSYIKLENNDKSFESNGNELLAIAVADHSNGTLHQNYHVKRTTDFPSEEEILNWFTAKTMSEYIGYIDSWLEKFPTKVTPDTQE